MAEVFLCQSGQLTAASRRELKKAGIVVVEVADPSECSFIRSGETVSHSDLLWAAPTRGTEAGKAVDAILAATDTYAETVADERIAERRAGRERLAQAAAETVRKRP